MPLYEHKSEGKVTERVRSVPESYNDGILAARAADEQSGWSLVDESKPAKAEQPGGQPGGQPGEQAPAATPSSERPGAKGGEQK